MICSKSYVVGQFLGYIGEEEYCLGDGSTWRIITPIYQVRRKQRPRVTVYRDENRYFMSVKGMGSDVEVEPVYLPKVMLETPAGRRSGPGIDDLEQQLEIAHQTKLALRKWRAYEESIKQLEECSA